MRNIFLIYLQKVKFAPDTETHPFLWAVRGGPRSGGGTACGWELGPGDMSCTPPASHVLSQQGEAASGVGCWESSVYGHWLLDVSRKALSSFRGRSSL